MMEYSINDSVDSGNHIRWDEANISTIPSLDIYNNIVGPAYTESNFDIARDFSAEDLCALDYDIPDEYLHQCLKTNHLLPQNDFFSIDNGKHDTLSSEVNKSIPAPIYSSREVQKKYIPGELYFRPFLMRDFQHSAGKIQEKIDNTLIERKSLFINGDSYDRSFRDAEMVSKLNSGNEQELQDPPFRTKHVSQKHYPLIEISNIVDENKLSSKITDSFNKHENFANANCETDEFNAEMKSVNCSDKKNTLKKRKPRTKLTASQLFFLNHAFAKNHYLTSKMGNLLSKRLDIPEACLKTWFQNQRARNKRMNLNNRNSLDRCEDSGSFPTQNFNGIWAVEIKDKAFI